jgi:predicted secreted acid phosphatase
MSRLLNKILSILFSAPIYFFALPAGYSEPINLSLHKNEVRTYYNSGQYDQEINKTIEQAQSYLSSKVNYYKQHKTTKKLALVLDIDETSLSNYDKLAVRDFANNPQQIHTEIMAGNNPAIKPVLKLYQQALHMGISVFFITGRIPSQLESTKHNLIKAGFKDWSDIYFRPDNYKHHSISLFKSASRAKIEQSGYIILATIGDQVSDLHGGHALRAFKLPNPFYYVP